MANKKFVTPVVFLSGTPGDEVETGGGTGQSTKDPFPCSYPDWQTMFEADYDFDEEINFNDYGQWWADNGFSEEDWNTYNPDVPFIWQP